MSEVNTPGVGEVLARHGLPAIPEAHCYVAWQGQRIDVTRAVVAVARAHPELTLDDAWRIREACIAALSDPR